MGKPKRRFLGQHFLKDVRFLNLMLESAGIEPDDIVIEIGTGKGELTTLLCSKAKEVISYELDDELYKKAMENLKDKNLTLIHGDGFNSQAKFHVLVSNIPYSRSSDFVEWLAEKEFKRAVATLQKEFVDKLLSSSGSKNYRAISAIAQACFDIRIISNLPPRSFSPMPKVYSVILFIVPRLTIQRETIISMKKIFSFRGRKVSTLLKYLVGKKDDYAFGEIDEKDKEKRVEGLSPNALMKLAKEVSRVDHDIPTI